MIPQLDTKKELIVELARRDPFLRIDEIAARAGTTPRYVRTILSEARVSLMELRRSYARLMEQKLECASKLSQPVWEKPTPSTRAETAALPGDLSVSRIVNSSYAYHLEVSLETPLLVVSQVQMCGPIRSVEQIILPGEFTLVFSSNREKKSLREIVGLAGLDSACKGRFVLVEPADSYTADLLDVCEGFPVLRCAAVLTRNRRPVALELSVFAAYMVEMRLDDCPYHIVPLPAYEKR